MARARSALVTGITGQDDPYLAEALPEPGLPRHQTRRSSTDSNERVGGVADRIDIVQGELLDLESVVVALDGV